MKNKNDKIKNYFLLDPAKPLAGTIHIEEYKFGLDKKKILFFKYLCV